MRLICITLVPYQTQLVSLSHSLSVVSLAGRFDAFSASLTDFPSLPLSFYLFSLNHSPTLKTPHKQKANRSSTLLDMHSKAADEAKKSGKSGDEGPAPIWDRDLHMNVMGKLMDDKSRTASIMDAKGLGSRFGHGKGGAFS